ncbi:MAG: (d)CMP kinase, partial [Planctomycetes bacterium]|nr:(d)CMP kinase [Planctomycetota bacterium]
EGRDQGTVVFPGAEVKFYLDASIEVRARRRHNDVGGDFEAIRGAIAERDERDRNRAVGGLRVPAGAIVIDTSEMTVEQVVEAMVAQALPTLDSGSPDH